MLVGVTGFGSVWRHRFGKQTHEGARCAQPVYYNTTGVVVNGKVCQRPQVCGYARFDAVGGFDPNHPSRMINRVFECAEPSVWMECNKLLFKRVLTTGEPPDYFLVIAGSDLTGQLAVGTEDWRSAGTWLISFSECRGQQEAMLLMPIHAWIRSRVGRFVLERLDPHGRFPRLVQRTGSDGS